MAAVDDVLAELESLGTEQTRKTYRRHGVGDNQYGVLYSALGKIEKRIKVDHELALALWDSGNHDARVLAAMIADPGQADPALLDAWANDVDNYTLGDAVSTFASSTPLAQETAERWIESDRELVAAMGWNMLGTIATKDRDLPDSYFDRLLSRIEVELADSQNRVRYSMNNALIAIGLRNESLEQTAVAVAGRLGTVVVDHGQTNCKTPDAIAYIEKTKAHRARRKK
ncbi:DNA alkylation repair protein [Gordonia westfalica]|uniref:DNA alkylation repair protein n=1 Tax=Gordonia westfalica TaxID=158898 RepID=A0ABU2GVC8_9ACTN|nr:DNA alkylation repair protein [Gordonia westfalica]MDS1114904.1 DNA alkylation repair protein [Gordonia westfalica]